MKPVLLLDVDGPLNVWAARRTEPESMRPWPLVDSELHFVALKNSEGFRLRWAPDIVRGLAQLPVEARWLSSWCVTCRPGPLKTNDHPNECLSPLFGWTELPDATERYPEELIAKLGHVWKYRVVQELANHRRPIVWIDDEAHDIADLPSREQCTTMPSLGVSNLVIAPDPKIGITQDDLKRIATWCNEV